MQSLKDLIQHPEYLDRETLFDLRNLVALHPYHQVARLLMLQNLYLLHDPTFDEELRRAVIYISDRKVLFRLFEAAHYKLPTLSEKNNNTESLVSNSQRTEQLIDSFLEQLPDEEKNNARSEKRRKPTPADAAVDYVAYLLECDGDDEEEPAPQMKGQSLIDNFLDNEGGRIVLPELPDEVPTDKKSDEAVTGTIIDVVSSTDDTNTAVTEKTQEEGIYTETLARIYVRQGRYSQALEIIKRLNLENPKKNSYFADQIRFLEKLIVNNNNKK